MIALESASLEVREAVAAERVRTAARELKRSVATAGVRVASEHGWVLPALGFLAGFLASIFSSPDRSLATPENGHDIRR